MKNENLVSLVPGRDLESWNELERESFLLGLYIFEKNFARLRQFIESKKVGDILPYYYGIFYKSDEYERWSDCRKSRGKKCILGPRFFSGLRLQEFIARLVPHVYEECKNSLMEVSREFGDDKIT
ncbi:homeodomain-like protein [Tanacetum coccineum]